MGYPISIISDASRPKPAFVLIPFVNVAPEAVNVLVAKARRSCDDVDGFDVVTHIVSREPGLTGVRLPHPDSMNPQMKSSTKAALGIMFLVAMTGCASSSPPSRIEEMVFQVRTNWITNVFNVVQVDPESSRVTNTLVYTNIEPRYHFTPKQSSLDTITTASSVATSAGAGWAGIAGTLIAGLLYGWAEFRNRRKAQLNTVLTNNVQVARETILATAGAGVEREYVDAIKSAQVKAGVKDLAAATVDNKVDEKEAREEAASVVSMGKRKHVVA